MDQLLLDAIGFPVRSGTLSRNAEEPGVHSWSIEIYCEESPPLDYRNWPDDRTEQTLDWLAGARPYLYSQMLPLPVRSPDELVGQTYSFPQSPEDEPADWDRGEGWLFFALYLFEHDLVYPMTVSFTKRQGTKYRVKAAGRYPCNETQLDLRVETWLDWVENPRLT